MKTLTIILLLFTMSAFSQSEKRDENEIKFENEPSQQEIRDLQKLNSKRKHITSLVMQFIDEKYVVIAETEIPKLEKKISSLKVKLAKTTNERHKEKINDAIQQVDVELQVHKMWKLYHKAFVMCVDARSKKDMKNYKYASNIINQIEKKYVVLKAEPFPSPQKEFSKLHAKKVQQFLSSQ